MPKWLDNAWGWTKKNAGTIAGGLIGGPVGAVAGSALTGGGLSKALGGKTRTEGPYALTEEDRADFQLPGGDYRRTVLEDYGRQMYGRTAPQVTEQGPWRQQQMDLAAALQRQASGQDSLSREQLKQSLGQALSQQQALAASARPGQGAMAARLAAQNSANIAQGLAGQQALAGIQERLAANQALGGMLGQARGQELGLGTQNAQLQQQQMGLNQQGLLGAFGGAQDVAQAQQQGTMGYQQQRTQRAGGQLGVPSVLEKGAEILGPVLGTAAMASDRNLKKNVKSAKKLADALVEQMGHMGEMSRATDRDMEMMRGMGMSDRNLKKGVQGGDKQADALITTLKPQSYEYKDPSIWGVGRRLGVMAQDLQKSPLGKQAVEKTSEGLLVSTPKLVGGLAAAVGRLGERLANVEGKGKPTYSVDVGPAEIEAPTDPSAHSRLHANGIRHMHYSREMPPVVSEPYQYRPPLPARAKTPDLRLVAPGEAPPIYGMQQGHYYVDTPKGRVEIPPTLIQRSRAGGRSLEEALPAAAEQTRYQARVRPIAAHAQGFPAAHAERPWPSLEAYERAHAGRAFHANQVDELTPDQIAELERRRAFAAAVAAKR